VAIIDEPEQAFEAPNKHYNYDQMSPIQKQLLKVVSKPKRVILCSTVHITHKPALFFPIARILRPDFVHSF
jgi:hypothetical protein